MKTYVARIEGMDQLRAQLREALGWMEWEKIVQPETRVFIKPNLTWQTPTPGVTTTPAFIEAVVSVMRERSNSIMVGEADGGYHSFVAEDAFQSHGLYDLSQRYGVELVNLSKVPVEVQSVTIGNHPVTVELPEVLLHGVDVFVTLPVPKIHAMTGVSLAFKNQWGCQPGTMRLWNHPDFSRRILAINILLKPRLALFDGTYFLDKTGPMIGEPMRMNLLIAADNLGAGDLACCELMGIDVRKVRHLRRAQREGMMPRTLGDVTLSQSLEPFKTHRFRLHRSLINYIALAAFHSRLGTRLFYDSPAAGPIHRVLYTIRKNRLIGWLLYGSSGPPTVEGRRQE